MKTLILIALVTIGLASATMAQNACVTWALTADQLATSTSGNVSAQPEIISSGSSAPLMSVYGYNAGQQLWVGNTGWIAGALDPSRYIEFNASPSAGNDLNVTSLSFDYNDLPLGTDFNIIAFQVYYSTDNWNTPNQLGVTGFYLNTVVQNFSAPLNATVNSGGTFSVRIYPYALQNGIAMTPTFATHKNVVICGNTSPTMAQNACVTWALTADQLPTSTSGYVSAQTEIISSGSNAPLMSVYGYNAGQQLWVGNTGWIAGALDPSRYIEFNASPSAGNDLNVTSLSFDYNDLPLGTDFNIIAFQVYYSTDNWNTPNQLGVTGFYLNTVVQNFSAPLNATVNSGGTFSVRIYPYALQNGIAMTPTFATHKNVVICGNTSPTMAQIACVTWALTADQLPTSTSGNVSAQTEIISSGSNAPLMSVYGYNAGQQLWVGNTGWIAGALDPSRYIEFNASPSAGNDLNVTSLSFDYNDLPLGTDFNIIAFQVYYSTDNWNTPNQLGVTGFYLNTVVQNFSAPLNVTVNSGGTFSVRIYPYALQNGIAMTPTFATHKNVVICGNTSPTLAVEKPNLEIICNIYPNPTNGLVYIDILNQAIQSIKVYDLQGQLIKETIESPINLSNFANGTYFIKAQAKQGIYSYKIIKQ